MTFSPNHHFYTHCNKPEPAIENIQTKNTHFAMDSCTVVEVELELRLLFFLPLPRNSYVNKIEFVCLCVCVCVCFFTLGRFQNSACSFSEVVVRVVHIGCSCFSPQEQEEKLAPAVFLALFHQLFICLAK